MPARDLDPLLAQVDARLGTPATWRRWPGGWQDDIEAALVDAVFSARAVYETQDGRGVKAQVVKWRAERDRTRFTVSALAGEIDAAGIEDWSHRFGNHQWSPGRPTDAPGGPSKASAVREAAGRLATTDLIADAATVTEPRLDLVRRELRTVPGIGIATSEYFLMLLGWPGVKPDRMIYRFLQRAYEVDLKPPEAKAVVTAAARVIQVSERDLDHAIWSYESERAAARSPARRP